MSSIKEQLLSYFSSRNAPYMDEINKIIANIPEENIPATLNFESVKTSIEKLIKNKPPRYLTNKEIDYILADLPETPCIIEKIRTHNLKQIKSKIYSQLSTIKVCPDKIDKLKDEIYTQYIKSVIPAGESVGLLSSMAIGQLFTQMNLNTFHSAGSKIVNGLSAIKELFNVTQNKKVYSTNIHFKNKDMTYREIDTAMKQNIEEVTVQKLIKSSEILKTVPDEDYYWYENSLLIDNIDRDKIKDKTFLRIKLDNVSMVTYNVSLEDIIINLRDLNQYLVISPINIGIIDIYANPNSAQDFNINSGSDFETVFLSGLINTCLEEMTIKGVKNLTDYSIETVEILKNINVKKTGSNKFRLFIDYFSIKLEGISKEKYINFIEVFNFEILSMNFETRPYYVDVSCNLDDIPVMLAKNVKNYNAMLNLISESNKDLYDLKPGNNDNIDEMYENLNLLFVNQSNPIKHINSSISIHKKKIQDLIQKLAEKNTYEESLKIKEELINATNHKVHLRSNYYYIVAYGKKILSKLIHITELDSNFILPNDINEIYEYFGIESARLYLVREYIRLITMSSFINPANIELLVDFQTSLGFLSQVTMTGVSKQQGSLLSSASFENPINVFKNGACMGKKDNIHGISGSIMSGKKCKNGSGIVKVRFENTTKAVDMFQEHDGLLAVDNFTVVDGQVRENVYNEELQNISNALNKKNIDVPEVKLPVKVKLDITTTTKHTDIKSELDLDDVNEQKPSINLKQIVSQFKVKPQSISAPYHKFLMRVNKIYNP